MRTPFVIAEFASCHDGQLEFMLSGVRVAQQCGADAFKTAWTSSPEQAAARMHLDSAEALTVVAWDRAWLPDIRRACLDAGLEFLCTVDLPEDIDVVAPYVDRFKIASWGATDTDFIEAHRDYGKPLVISYGLGAEPLEPPRYDDWLLHCVSGYPTPMAEANLRVVAGYGGFSDHTRNTITGALAVAAGARVLEVHFALTETNPKNPDRVVSLMPWELQSYIAGARLAYQALGDGVKRVMPSEEKNVRHRYV